MFSKHMLLNKNICYLIGKNICAGVFVLCVDNELFHDFYIIYTYRINIFINRPFCGGRSVVVLFTTVYNKYISVNNFKKLLIPELTESFMACFY